jgi:sulfofructose kinase
VSRLGSALVKPPDFDAVLLEGCDLLLADPRCPLWAEAALRGMRERGRPSVFDGDVAPPADLRRLAGLAHWAVFSSQGMRAWLGLTVEDDLTDDHLVRGLDELLEAGAEVAVITQGERGLRWRRRGRPPQSMAAYEAGPVVDTLGAGDVFHGALGVALAEGQSDDDALRFASMAAALKCTGAGGIAAAPSGDQVRAAQARSVGGR